MTISELSNNILSLVSSVPQLRESEILYNEPMSRHTTFRIGGAAAALAFPKSTAELKCLADTLSSGGINFIVIGNGSNLLVRDVGISAAVISTTKISEIKFSDENGTVICGCGAMLPRVSAQCAKSGLSGFEFAAAIPGTIGGGIVMNCGAYGGCMADVVEETEYLSPNGEIKLLPRAEHAFSYRNSFFAKNPQNIVLSAKIKLRRAEKSLIEAAIRENIARRAGQPTDKPSAGSVFKRSGDISAGKLIEECGLKGFRVGGACISPKHAGFVVNNGGASADDVLRLIDLARNSVKSKFGIELECEIKII